MSSFPLYETLNVNISHVDLTTNQKEDFIDMIKKFDIDGMEKIYALIRMHQFENSNDKSTFKLPYNGKYVKNDVKFDLDGLPNDLKQILYKFSIIHTNFIKENKNI
jgi:uncharacterized protein (UPF0371 family)